MTDLVIGRVIRTHGVKGELVVDVCTDEPELRFMPGARLVAKYLKISKKLAISSDAAVVQEYTVQSAREHSGRLLLSLVGVVDRDSAETFRGKAFVIDSASVSSGDDPDAFYDHELVGLLAFTVGEEEIGQIRDVIHSPGGEILVVVNADGIEFLIPFVREIVPVVDVPAGRVVVDPPDGLFDVE